MALEFYIVTNCPMKGLYRNLKTAKRQCQRYETAALHRFYSPGDISAARACCNEDGIKVTKKTWDDLYFAGKMTTCILQSVTDVDAFQSGRFAKQNGRPKTHKIPSLSTL